MRLWSCLPLDGKAPAWLGLVRTTDGKRLGRRAGVSPVPRAWSR